MSEDGPHLILHVPGGDGSYPGLVGMRSPSPAFRETIGAPKGKELVLKVLHPIDEEYKEGTWVLILAQRSRQLYSFRQPIFIEHLLCTSILLGLRVQ